MSVNSENLVFMIHRASALLKICEDKVSGEYKLTSERYAVLTAIKSLDQPVRITDVAQRLTRNVNSVSTIVDRMANDGLVRRVRDRKDRRTVFVTITSKAEGALEPATLAGQELTRKILSPLPYGDRRILHGLLLTVQHEASEYLKGR